MIQWDTVKATLSAWQGDKEAVTVYRFRNTGPSAVTITSVSTSCSCTTTQLEKGTYAPGEAGQIKAVMEIGGRVGPQEKFITVSTDEAGAQPTILSLQVDIQELVICAPRIVSWQRGEPAAEKAVEIDAGPDQKITLRDAVPVDPAVTARLETVETGKRYRVWIKPSATDRRLVVDIPCTVQVEGRPPPPLTVFASVN